MITVQKEQMAFISFVMVMVMATQRVWPRMPDAGTGIRVATLKSSQ